MATRLKPSRINVDNNPRVGDGAAYQNDNDFHWSEGGGDMSYEDFEWVTLTGNSIVIEDISNNVTPSDDFTVSAGTVREGIEYVLRVNMGNTGHTMTLGNGITNPNGYDYSLKVNTINQFKFIAISSSQLELEGVESGFVTLSTAQTISGKKTFSVEPVLPSKSTTAGNNPTKPATEAQVYPKANDVEVVHKSGTETITGTKTFSVDPVLPNKTSSPTNDGTKPATEAQVYDVDTNSVKITGNQTVNGTKTFGTSPVVPSKTTDATNTGTAIATEAQVYKKANKVASATADNLASLTSAGDLADSGIAKGTVELNTNKETGNAPTDDTTKYPSSHTVKKYVDDQVSAATAGAVSNEAYNASSWDGVTGIAPSKNAVRDKIVTMDSSISTIEGKIPSAASTSNQLADKDFVNSSINSVTAYYITKNAAGDQFATYAELAAATTFYSGGEVRVPTRNDYCIVQDDENHDHATTRYIYNNGWEYQYTINETPLTQAQLDALNSGITAGKVTTYDGYATTIASKANDNEVVKLSGNQTINGTKTFGTSPVVPSKTTAAKNTGTDVATEAQVYKKQDKLVSGTNIKKINNNSLLGSGNLTLNDVKVSSTAPSSPTEGMVWYDTTNDQLKVYDGTNWNVTGKEYNAGEGIEIGTAQDYSAMQGPAPDGFHVPLSTEWQAVYNVWTALGGGSSDGTNFGIALKLPFAGLRDYSSAVFSHGTRGHYWSSSHRSTSSAYFLTFLSTFITTNEYDDRAYGFSVRCFKNSPIIPTSSWTTLYDGSSVATGAGVFHNASLGLISVSGDGTTWYTIMDKNLGATTVWNSGDTLSEANCGKYYQWGNNYGFSWTGSVTTSSTQVDASSYGPNTSNGYYESSTFITGSDDWSSVHNDNLWGGTTGVVTLNNAITNTGVLSVNGQTGDVTIESGGIQLAPNSPLTVKYHWYGTQAQYDALQQYYTDTVDDTAYFTI